jgi:hypothetical protein
MQYFGAQEVLEKNNWIRGFRTKVIEHPYRYRNNLSKLIKTAS